MTAHHLDLPQGTLDLLILRTLALGPLHDWPSPGACSTSRRTADSARLSISGGLPAGASWLDQGSLENLRKHPPRQILRAFKERP
jgi:hypothetical protein